MRIAVLVGGFPSLSETFILNQITGLIDRGHEVDIYAEYRPDQPTAHPDVARFNLLARTTYRPHMPKSWLLRHPKGLALFLLGMVRKPAMTLAAVNVFKHGYRSASLKMLYSAMPFMSHKPYDIVHCHFGPRGLTGLDLRGLGAVRGKLVTTFHGHGVCEERCQGAYYQELFRKGDLFTVNTEFIRGRVISLGAPPDRIAKLPMGVDLRRYPGTNGRPNDGGPVRLLSVARLKEEKGIDCALRAVAEVAKTHPRIEYSVVGDGPWHHRLAALAEELGIADKVKLLGWRTHGQLPDIYAEADIFLLPSVAVPGKAEEGQGLVLMEAQASRLPVVGTRVGGIPEGLLDGESGFLVPERDPSAVAERLCYLIERPEIWPGMGRAGRAFVEANYDVEPLNDRLVELYRGLLAGT